MTTQGTVADDPVWRIQPSRDSFFGQLAALWRYRSVSVALAQQILSNRSRRKFLGLPWIYVQPLVFTIPPLLIMGKVFNISVAPLPLPMFIISGFAIWMLIRRGMQQVTRSLKMYRSVGRRIYVPPYMFVCASLSPAIVQFSFFVVVLVGTCCLLWADHGTVLCSPRVAFARDRPINPPSTASDRRLGIDNVHFVQYAPGHDLDSEICAEWFDVYYSNHVPSRGHSRSPPLAALRQPPDTARRVFPVFSLRIRDVGCFLPCCRYGGCGYSAVRRWCLFFQAAESRPRLCIARRKPR